MTMHAPVERVWDLVSDVTRIGEFSPETFEAEWADEAAEPGVGRRFRGHVRRNQRGPTYWSECVVTDHEPLRRFGFDVVVGGAPVNHWQYDLEPVDGADATVVTESFRLAASPMTRAYWAVLGRWRSGTNERGMRTTLERIRDVVEAEASAATG
ncbi:SRPBCC family protein [Ilumatobacter sp.]|uniref:SRPBCC family protein n=1 Tax=Ilumatobacter sp. TaxID=1967498 RepID=UPI003B529312